MQLSSLHQALDQSLILQYSKPSSIFKRVTTNCDPRAYAFAATSSFAGSAQMMAQLGSSSMSRQHAVHDRENVRSVEQSMAKYGQSGAMGPATAQGTQTFATSASGTSLGSGVGGQSVVGDKMGLNRAPEHECA
jgi:hypothetical protein